MVIQPFLWRRRGTLADAYIHLDERVQHLYEYRYRQHDAWRQQHGHLLKSAAEQTCAPREGLVKALLSYNRQAWNDERALAGIRSLLDPDTTVIVGGQQAGLFTGPLLVIHKAISVIQRAREAERLLGKRVLPLFWIAGEDHDWEEVNHFYYCDDSLRVQKYRLPQAAPARKAPVSGVKLHREMWADALAHMRDSLPDSVHKKSIMERLQTIAFSSAHLSIAFARILAWLFGRHGLVVMDPTDGEMRRLAAPFFSEMISRNPSLNESLLAGARLVRESGYEPQAEVDPESAQLFIVEKGERLLLQKKGERFADKRGLVRFTAEELEGIARSQPERLSNNALTRPLMQQYLLPVLAVVLGPAEIAYWGIIKPAFHLFGMRMPIVLARTGFTLLDDGLRKVMEQYRLSFEDVVFRLQEKKEAWIRAQDTLDIEGLFRDARSRFERLYADVIRRIETIHPGMRKIGENNRDRIVRQIEYLQRKTEEAHRLKLSSSLHQWERLSTHLLPLGKPQERVYNVFHYLNRHGEQWLDELVRQQLIEPERHYFVQL